MHGARAVITEAILIQLNVQNASAALSVPRLPEIKCLEQSIWCIKWIGILPRIDVQWWVKIESLPEAVWGGTVPGRLVLETRAVFSQTSVLHRCYKQGDEDTGKQDLASVGKQCLRKYLFASHNFIRLCEAHRYTSLYTSKLKSSWSRRLCSYPQLQFTSKMLLWSGFYFSFLIAEHLSLMRMYYICTGQKGMMWIWAVPGISLSQPRVFMA